MLPVPVGRSRPLVQRWSSGGSGMNADRSHHLRIDITSRFSDGSAHRNQLGRQVFSDFYRSWRIGQYPWSVGAKSKDHQRRSGTPSVPGGQQPLNWTLRCDCRRNGFDSRTAVYGPWRPSLSPCQLAKTRLLLRIRGHPRTESFLQVLYRTTPQSSLHQLPLSLN